MYFCWGMVLCSLKNTVFWFSKYFACVIRFLNLWKGNRHLTRRAVTTREGVKRKNWQNQVVAHSTPVARLTEFVAKFRLEDLLLNVALIWIYWYKFLCDPRFFKVIYAVLRKLYLSETSNLRSKLTHFKKGVSLPKDINHPFWVSLQ